MSHGSALRRGILWWLGLSAVGVVVILVPDDGDRLVSFSRDHGPSAVDAVGVGILLVGWWRFAVPLWRGRRRIRHPLGLSAGAAGAAAVTVWSVAGDAGAWWLAGAAGLVVIQLAAARTALRPHARSEDLATPGAGMPGEGPIQGS